MNDRQPARLETLGVLLVTGADARNFLQGQVTADLHTLTANNLLLAACNSPQGRVQAVLWIIERTDGIALVTNGALLPQTAARLRRYVLRAKATIEPERLHVGIASPTESPTESISHRQDGEISYVRLPGHERALVIAPPSVDFAIDPSAVEKWHLDHVRAGLPEIYTQTHEAFVAQMLNLDLLGGIDFEKGCYTGQEIIARTHYRGAVKRRMFRFRAGCTPPPPGTRLVTGDQHAGDVVDSIAVDDGCELLAVVSLAQLDQPLELETNRGVTMERLALPYDVRSDEVTQ